MHLSELIKSLELIQHPEGGWFKETYTSEMTTSGRSIMSMIYYLLKKDFLRGLLFLFHLRFQI